MPGSVPFKPSAIGRRLTKIAAALLFGFVFLVSRQAQAQGLRFWTALPEPDHAVMAELVSAYNDHHASAPVDYRNFSSRAELLKALQQNDLPNLALIDSTWIPPLKAKLFPAEDILAKAGSMVRAVAKADTFQPIWDAAVVEEKAYAIPFSAETAALAINPVYFKKVPAIKTFAQWQKAALKVEKSPVNVSPVAFPSSWEAPEFGKLWTYFAMANSKSPFWEKLLRKEKSEDHPLTLTDEEAALNLWWNWVNRSKLMSVPGSYPADAFIHGAMWILHPREVESLHDSATVEPLPKLKRPWSFLRVDALAFFGDGKAWDFANFLTDYPQIKAWSMRTPTVPVNKQVFLSPDYIQDMDARRPWLRVYIAAVNRQPHDLDFTEEQLMQVGETVLEALDKKLKVQEAALKIHESLFGAKGVP